MGGEKPRFSHWAATSLGSPPHGRGKADFNVCSYRECGITPAWAGKSFPAGCPRSRSRDHPRVGGEKRPFSSRKHTVWGSPPRRRGKGRPAQGGTPATGITPAWAGKSPSCPTHSAARRDHPRVGGEKLKSGSTAAGCPGSPPRGREKILEPSMGVGNFGSPPRGRGKARHLSHGLLPCG